MICTWKYDDSNDCWETSCGNTFVLLDGSPEDNGMKYCGLRLPTPIIPDTQGNTNNEPIPKDVRWLQAIADTI